MKRRIKSWGINWTCTLMNLNGEIIRYADLNHDIGWRDHLRWKIEGWLSRAFGFFYDGSDEEIRDALDDSIPVEYMSQRQLEAFLADKGGVE